MASLNKVFLIGRLGKDPVIKTFSNENSIAEFSLATNEYYTDRDGNRVELTDWHNIKVPSTQQARVAEKYLKKGSLVHIEGKLKTRSYEDQQGVKKYVTEVVVDRFEFLDSKPSDTSHPQTESPAAYQPSDNEPLPQSTDSDDGLPF